MINFREISAFVWAASGLLSSLLLPVVCLCFLDERDYLLSLDKFTKLKHEHVEILKKPNGNPLLQLYSRNMLHPSLVIQPYLLLHGTELLLPERCASANQSTPVTGVDKISTWLFDAKRRLWFGWHFSSSSSMGLSESQWLALAAAPKVPAFLSVLASSWIVTEVLTKPHKRSTLYHRIMLGLASMDIIFSLAAFASTWPIPHEATPMWSAGNDLTCNLQGFMIQLSTSCFIYVSTRFTLS